MLSDLHLPLPPSHPQQNTTRPTKHTLSRLKTDKHTWYEDRQQLLHRVHGVEEHLSVLLVRQLLLPLLDHLWHFGHPCFEWGWTLKTVATGSQSQRPSSGRQRHSLLCARCWYRRFNCIPAVRGWEVSPEELINWVAPSRSSLREWLILHNEASVGY